MFTSFVRFLIDPFNVLWILGVSSLVAWYFSKKVFLKRCLYTLICSFILFSTPLLPTLLLNSLESEYTPLDLSQIPDLGAKYHIVILGGGHGLDDQLPANSLLSRSALGRLAEGIRIHRQLPNSKLVLSGFSCSGGTTQAEMLNKTALLLGVKEEAILLQKEPGNTFKEAKVFNSTFGNNFRL